LEDTFLVYDKGVVMPKKEILITTIATFAIFYVLFIIFTSTDVYCSTPPNIFPFNILKVLTTAIIIFIILGLVMSLKGIIPVPDMKKEDKNA
jgi:hypothetical protein